jgi:hypothetical protein
MKKLIISIPLLIILTGTLVTGCKKSQIDNDYFSPDNAVTASVSSLYSGLFYNEKVMPRYWNLYTFLIPMMGTYSQTAGYTNTGKVYEQAVNYTKDRWDYFYTTTIARYREIEKYYNALTSDADKQGYQIFLETARIFVYDQTAQMVDMWGDIPFSTAGQLNATGTITLASYDKGQDIYNNILTDLKRISDYLSGVTLNGNYQTQFSSYDYVNKGSIDKWRKYCNSLMLRLAMRISNQNEAAAKSIIQPILSNSTQYPVISSVDDNVTIQPSDITSTLTSVNDIRNGFGVNPFAPGKMVDTIMVPSNDPRLPVYFTTNKRGEYHGVPLTWNSTRVSDSTTANYFSRWDSTTFTENNLFPGIIMEAAEVSFIKAEAYERWGGGNAKNAYETGIKQSIQFYVKINNNSDYKGFKEKMPSDSIINVYLTKPLVAYDGTNNLEKIATQKWIDFNIMQANQAWAEWRRTKLPKLTFPTDPLSVLSPNVPNRLLYPSTESSLNSANYATVKSADNVNTKVFWDVK